MEEIIKILEELKQEEYEKYCSVGFSVLGEKEWDYVIRNVKEKMNQTNNFRRGDNMEEVLEKLKDRMIDLRSRGEIESIKFNTVKAGVLFSMANELERAIELIESEGIK